MDYKKKLSIIVPVYNTERYLKRCLDSALSALPLNSEILIINDGSPDNSEKIAKSYVEKYPEVVRYFYKRNGGLSDAKNFGLRESEGEYIIFLDSDDYVDSQIYRELFAAIEETGAELAVCDIDCVSEENGASNISHCYNTNRGSSFFQILDTPLVAASWNKIIHRRLFLGLEYPVGLNNEDVAITPILMGRANRCVIVKKPLYKYVQRSGSIQNSAFTNKRFVIIDTTKLAVNYSIEFPVTMQQQIKGSLYVHQILGLLLYPIRKQKFSSRYAMIKEYMKRVESTFDDFFTNQYVQDNALNDSYKNRIFKRLSTRLLEKRLYLVTSLFFTVVNVAEKILVAKKGG
ncbi:glycosyltransferase family 2 protein [Paenibacillus polysaccharolyticus]|uniref:glycosyltransferase family 2 protein n=1 Tax=Paenibacillus polysaccharolyticus TaxID=582692 RepID=UPI00280B81FC|nr:glycosyltransferase family 2 protein [Paenibacillus polysaccharolyticus]